MKTVDLDTPLSYAHYSVSTDQRKTYFLKCAVCCGRPPFSK